MLPLQHLLFVLWACVLCIAPVLAQFGNFFQHGFPFGGQQQQHHQDPHPGSHRQYKGWAEFETGKLLVLRSSPVVVVTSELIRAVHCRAGYVCPASLACVPTPADCPCPYPLVSRPHSTAAEVTDRRSEDIKCVLPDERLRDEGEGPPFVCVREGRGCEEAMTFSKPI